MSSRILICAGKLNHWQQILLIAFLKVIDSLRSFLRMFAKYPFNNCSFQLYFTGKSNISSKKKWLINFMSQNITQVLYLQTPYFCICRSALSVLSILLYRAILKAHTFKSGDFIQLIILLLHQEHS